MFVLLRLDLHDEDVHTRLLAEKIKMTQNVTLSRRGRATYAIDATLPSYTYQPPPSVIFVPPPPPPATQKLTFVVLPFCQPQTYLPSTLNPPLPTPSSPISKHRSRRQWQIKPSLPRRLPPPQPPIRHSPPPSPTNTVNPPLKPAKTATTNHK